MSYLPPVFKNSLFRVKNFSKTFGKTLDKSLNRDYNTECKQLLAAKRV